MKNILSMKKMYRFLGVALLTGLIAAGCHKSSGSTAITMQSLSASYKITASSALVEGISFNTYDSIPACERDDILKLNPDSTYDYEDVGVSCTPNGSFTGFWSLSGGIIDIDSTFYTIKSFTGATLVLSTTDTLSGIPVVATETLTKQ